MRRKFLQDIYLEHFVIFGASGHTHYSLVIFAKYACKCQKVAALRIESFWCNHGINVVLTGLNSARQRIQVKCKEKSSTYDTNRIRMPLKLEERENRLFLQNLIAFKLSNLVKFVMVL